MDEGISFFGVDAHSSYKHRYRHTDDSALRLSKQLSESIKESKIQNLQGYFAECNEPFNMNWQDAAYITLKEADWLDSSCLKAYNKQPEAVNFTRLG